MNYLYVDLFSNVPQEISIDRTSDTGIFSGNQHRNSEIIICNRKSV
jgi:hypothetical protein